MAGSAFSSGDAEDAAPSEDEYACGALAQRRSPGEKALDSLGVALDNLTDAIGAMRKVEHRLNEVQLSPDDAYLSCELMADSMYGEPRLMYTI